MTEISIPDSVLETFRCSLCRRYLSCAPVQVLTDGSSICSICSRSAEQPTYRVLDFEAFLSKLSFPCWFKNNGCEERISFGQTDEHEANCAYHASTCPALTNCAWKGSAVQIFEHFNEKHSNLINENAEFKLELDQDEEGIFIFTLDDVCFIVKYKYNAATSKLRCDVRFLTNIQEAMYKIRLVNDSDYDYSSTVKGGNILPYNHHFNSMQNSKTIILNNYFEGLDNPSCITVAVVVTKFNQEDESAKQLTVDYELLQSLRCGTCHGYLIPPLYDSQNGPVCYHCKEKFKHTKPLHNNELKQRVAKINFPCRWQYCDFVGKPENILKHDSICQFRIFNCTNCDKTFTWAEALIHLKNHGLEYFTDAFVYKMSLDKSYPQKTIFAFKDNEIIFVNHKTQSRYGWHDIESHYTGSCLSSLKVEFQHAHCKVKSKKFTLQNSGLSGVSGVRISSEDLPDCFKSNEQLTVTIKI